MQALQQALWKLQGPRVLTHVGDLAWWVHRAPGKRRLWLDRDRCVAWAWLHAPASLDFGVHPDVRVQDDVLEWFESEAEGDVLTTYALDGDRLHGYEPSGVGYAYYVHDLDVAEPHAPDGFVLHPVAGEDDFRRRVEVHRAVWAPSRVTADVYRRIAQTWPYRAELDCVLEAPDATFAAYALCWYDDANGVGELEPVGTHPDFRRRGLGALVCRYALWRLRQAGARQAVVYAGEPGAQALYESIGFRQHTRAVELRRARA
jgi:ribosomal protein S18 acetylase RimI-like enzyme